MRGSARRSGALADASSRPLAEAAARGRGPARARPRARRAPGRAGATPSRAGRDRAALEWSAIGAVGERLFAGHAEAHPSRRRRRAHALDGARGGARGARRPARLRQPPHARGRRAPRDAGRAARPPDGGAATCSRARTAGSGGSPSPAASWRSSSSTSSCSRAPRPAVRRRHRPAARAPRRAARRYPATPLAVRDLLARRDEIGALTRTLARLAEDSDGRRRAAADLGADIAHEFKNPLATIAASAELLASAKPPTPERVELVAEHDHRLGRAPPPVDRRSAAPPAARAGAARRGARARAHRIVLRELAGEYARDPRGAGWRFDVEVVARRRAARAAARARALHRARPQPRRERARAARDGAAPRPRGARREGGDLVLPLRDHGPGISRREPGAHLRALLHAAARGRAARDRPRPLDCRQRRARPRGPRRGPVRAGPGRGILRHSSRL